MARRLAAVVLLVAACSAGPQAEPSPAPSPSVAPEPSVTTTTSTPAPTDPPSASEPTSVPPSASEPRPPADFDTGDALAVARHLAEQIGARPAGSDGDEETRAYLTEQFRGAGWQVEEDEFALPQGGTSANVMAWWGDRGRLDGPLVVVGSHMDTKPNTPGANDNASGTGVLVALARALAGQAEQLPVPVVFVAFGAEEFQAGTGAHHLGSEHLAARVADRTIAMMSVDMIGNGPTLRVVRLRDATDVLQRRLVAVADAKGIADVVTDVRGDISDHGPFAKRGVPAAFLWTGDDGRYHTPADTFEHLDPADVERAGTLTLALLRGLDTEDRDGLRPTTD